MLLLWEISLNADIQTGALALSAWINCGAIDSAGSDIQAPHVNNSTENSNEFIGYYYNTLSVIIFSESMEATPSSSKSPS